VGRARPVLFPGDAGVHGLTLAVCCTVFLQRCPLYSSSHRLRSSPTSCVQKKVESPCPALQSCPVLMQG